MFFTQCTSLACSRFVWSNLSSCYSITMTQCHSVTYESEVSKIDQQPGSQMEAFMPKREKLHVQKTRYIRLENRHSYLLQEAQNQCASFVKRRWLL